LISLESRGTSYTGNRLELAKDGEKNFIVLSYKEVVVFTEEFNTLSGSWKITDRYSKREYEYAPFLLDGRWGFIKRSQEGEAMWFTGNALEAKHRVRGGVQVDPSIYYFDLLHKERATRRLR